MNLPVGSDVLTCVLHLHCCHRSRNGQEKFKPLREVREKWNFKGTNLFIASSAMFLCKQAFELSMSRWLKQKFYAHI